MKRRFTKMYRLTAQENEAVIGYLKGDLSAREAAQQIGCSHQQIINMVASLARFWYAEKKLKI